MNGPEALELLKKAAALDSRIGTIDKDRAKTWAQLFGHIPYNVAELALMDHYQHETVMFLPAHMKPALKRLMAEKKIEQAKADYQRRGREERELGAGYSRPSVSVQVKPLTAREKKRQKHVDAVAAQDDRAACNPEYAQALAFMRSRCSPTVVCDLESWKVPYQGARGSGRDVDVEQLGAALQKIPGELGKQAVGDVV